MSDLTCMVSVAAHCDGALGCCVDVSLMVSCRFFRSSKRFVFVRLMRIGQVYSGLLFSNIESQRRSSGVKLDRL